MSSSEAQRTLVKSPPELWAELSDPAALARHLGELGEIQVTRTEPEELVEWEAEAARGTVRIEPSGWGTKVTLTVTREAPEPQPDAAPEATPEPQAEPTPEPRRGFFARLWRRRRTEQPVSDPEPQPVEETPDLAAELARVEESLAEQDAALLAAVLDRLGAAHHRPFSRA
jgi:hypothetical protein